MKTIVTLIALIAMTGCVSLPTDTSTVQDAECRKLNTMKIQRGYNVRCSSYSSGSATCSGGPNWTEVLVEENFDRCMTQDPQKVHAQYMAKKADHDKRCVPTPGYVNWGTCENVYPPYAPEFK